MKRLFIAEKPSVAKALAAEIGQTATGSGWIRCGDDVLTWCFGHMLEQAEPDTYTPDTVPRGKNGKKLWRVDDLPIIPTVWQSVVKEDARAQLSAIGKLLQDAESVVHAGDPDHEGQLLVDEVLEHFECRRPVLRFWASAQDSVSIQRALAALSDNSKYAGWRDAARGRQRADWLLGMNLTRAFTLRAQRGGSSSVLTVGRVQTPTLALVVQLDRKIEEFKAQPFHTISARIMKETTTDAFVGKWTAGADQAGLDEEGRLIDTQIADALVRTVSGQKGVVTKYELTPKRTTQPLAFSLTDLSVAASKKYGYSADKVLEIAQALYDQYKLASYPRTDCAYLPESQHADAPAVLSALKRVNPELTTEIDRADSTMKSRVWDDRKITAHHGIVPTMHHGSKEGMSEEARNVYELIVRAYLAQFYAVHEYSVTTIEVDLSGEKFLAKGRVVTASGWKTIYEDESEEEASEDEQSLPMMSPGDSVRCVDAVRKDQKTSPPARYTDGTLLRAMENVHRFVDDPTHRKILRDGDGIGTSATRATIVTELKRRGFLEDRKKTVVSTPLGRSVIDALPTVLKSPVLTAMNQRVLGGIERGEERLEIFVQKQCEFVRAQVAKANDGAIKLRDEKIVPQRVGPAAGKGSKGTAQLAKG